VGKLWDIPMDLFGKITELEYGERVIADIVKNAENEILVKMVLFALFNNNKPRS